LNASTAEEAANEVMRPACKCIEPLLKAQVKDNFPHQGYDCSTCLLPTSKFAIDTHAGVKITVKHQLKSRNFTNITG